MSDEYEPIEAEFESREPDEYDEGAQAYRRGIDRRECPYTIEVQAELWLMGWDEAQTDAEEI